MSKAASLEQLGDDEAACGRAAAGYYAEAQRVLLPPGKVWHDREEYTQRMEAFERVQSKLYGLDGSGRPRDFLTRPAEQRIEQQEPTADPQPEAKATSFDAVELPVWNFYPGLEVRVLKAFRDYDGQEIGAGEILHFIEGSYFSYDGGHTLRFAEKTIRLADVVEEHQPIIANKGNVWFHPLIGQQTSSPRI